MHPGPCMFAKSPSAPLSCVRRSSRHGFICRPERRHDASGTQPVGGATSSGVARAVRVATHPWTTPRTCDLSVGREPGEPGESAQGADQLLAVTKIRVIPATNSGDERR